MHAFIHTHIRVCIYIIIKIHVHVYAHIMKALYQTREMQDDIISQKYHYRGPNKIFDKMILDVLTSV